MPAQKHEHKSLGRDKDIHFRETIAVRTALCAGATALYLTGFRFDSANGVINALYFPPHCFCNFSRLIPL